MAKQINRTVKEKLSQKEDRNVLGRTITEALPIVLCSMSATYKDTAQPISLPGTSDLSTADVSLTSEALVKL